MWQLLVTAGILFVSCGGFYSVLAQGGSPLPSSISRTRPDNPKVNRNHSATRAKTRSASVSPEEQKRQALEQSIKESNDARDKFDYERALSSYRKAIELDAKDPRSYYGLGNVYYAVYCYDSALDFYGQAVKRKPDFLEALVQLGYAYALKERYDEAGANFDAAYKLNPKNISARLGSLYVKAKRGNYQDAIEQLNQVINDKSMDVKERTAAYMVLGDVYVAQNKWQESTAPFQKATLLSPDLAEAYLKLGTSQMVSGYQKFDLPQSSLRMEHRENLSAAARQASENMRIAIDAKHYDHPNGYLLLGMALMYQFNYQGAMSKIDLYLSKVKELEGRLLGLDSRLGQKCDYAFGRLYADGYSELGMVYERQANGEADARKAELLNEAIRQYQKAIETKQDYTAAYQQLGTIYLGQGRFADTIEQYKKALLYEPNESNKGSLYSILGLAYGQIGQEDEAIFYLKKAIALDDDNASTYTSLAQVYSRQGNLDEAIRLGREAVARERRANLTPSYILASNYFERARKNNNEADYEESIKLLNEVIKINPTFASAYLMLGHVFKSYKNGERVKEAVAYYELAAKYDKDNAAIYFSLGDLHTSVIQNNDAAIKYLKEAIRLKPDYALAYWMLGLVYREKKETAEAIKQFLEGMKYQTDSQACQILADIYDSEKYYAEATKWLREAVSLDPTSHFPYLNLARVYTHQRKNSQAITYYEETIKRLKPDDSGNKNLYLCRIVRLQAKYGEALACFEKLVYPIADQVPYELGVTYLDSGNKKAALAQHQQLVQLKSALADALLQQINEMSSVM